MSRLIEVTNGILFTAFMVIASIFLVVMTSVVLVTMKERLDDRVRKDERRTIYEQCLIRGSESAQCSWILKATGRASK